MAARCVAVVVKLVATIVVISCHCEWLSNLQRSHKQRMCARTLKHVQKVHKANKPVKSEFKGYAERSLIMNGGSIRERPRSPSKMAKKRSIIRPNHTHSISYAYDSSQFYISEN